MLTESVTLMKEECSNFLGLLGFSLRSFPFKLHEIADRRVKLSVQDAAVSLEMPMEERASAKRRTEISFPIDPRIPFPFQGRKIAFDLSSNLQPLRNLEPGDTILARSADGPVWTVRTGPMGEYYSSAFPLPGVKQTGALIDVITPARLIEVIPVLEYLRGFAGNSKPPELRACFIFDDPNLHRPSYGYVNYAEIARRGSKFNYHVSFATVPLDAWYTHAPTAKIFRESKTNISLSIHGNNHVKRELALPYCEQQRHALLREAVNRIARLERKAGVSVCRVMVPPHGACSSEMLEALPLCGFSGASVSHGSLRAYNPNAAWTRRLGISPVEVVNGCRVTPRWAISPNSENEICYAAYFGQAIILRAHHQDLRGGVELLDVNAQHINGLGDVKWSALTEILDGFQVKSSDPEASHQDKIVKTYTGFQYSVRCRALMRRVLAEARDRIDPLIHSRRH
jgi:hypothetical protein